MAFNEFATHRPSSKAYRGRNVNPQLSMAPLSDVVPANVMLPPLVIRIQAIPALAIIAQALQDRTVHVFEYSPALRSCSCPSPFRVQVSRSPRSRLP